MDCAEPHLSPLLIGKCWPMVAALLLVSPVCGGGHCWGQRDSAATEAESGGAPALWERGDVHRDGDLRGLCAVDGSLHGAEHLSQFLAAWYSLLFEAPDSAAAVGGPLEAVHFGGSHVQAGRIGWAFRQRLHQDRPGVVVG